MKAYTFPDGSATLPVGEMIVSPGLFVHLDNSIYANAREYDGFQFSQMRENDSENPKFHAVHTSTEFLAFGYGRHSW